MALSQVTMNDQWSQLALLVVLRPLVSPEGPYHVFDIGLVSLRWVRGNMSMDEELALEVESVLGGSQGSASESEVGWRTGLAVLWFQSHSGLESHNVTLVKGLFSPSVRPVIPDWRQRLLAA